jgi:mannose-6-phosphate isomerase-like protein (cupin superfamily)
MAVTLEGGCRVSEMHEGEPVVNGSVRIWNQIGKASGAQAISLRVMEFAPGLSPRIRNGDCDEILYVLAVGAESAKYNSQGQARSASPLGQVSSQSPHPEGVRDDNQQIKLILDDKSFHVTAETGVYIRPHETFAIDNPTTNPVVVISSSCPDPNRAQEFVDRPSVNPASRSDAAKPFVRLSDRAPESTADRWYRVLVDHEIGSEQVTQFVGSIPPGRAPDHFHTYEEVLFILKGEGHMWAGQTNTPIGPGSCIFLPKRQVHCVENTGNGELRLLGVFYPAGSPSVRYDV